MGKFNLMRLIDYLQESEMTYTDLAEKLSVSAVAVHRYANGTRIPQNGVMQKIVKATNGKVTANDFYQ